MTASPEGVKRYHSAYPGSMFEHPPGEYADEFVRASAYDRLAEDHAQLQADRTIKVGNLETRVARLEGALHATDEKVMAAAKATHPKARAILIDEAHDILMRAALAKDEA